MMKILKRRLHNTGESVAAPAAVETPVADSTVVAQQSEVQNDDWEAIAETISNTDIEDSETPTDTSSSEVVSGEPVPEVPVVEEVAVSATVTPAEAEVLIPETPAAVQPETPAATAAAEVTPQTQESVVTPPVEELTPEQKQEQAIAAEAKYSADRQAAVDALTQQYQFSDEDAQLIYTAPEQVLPKLAAEIQMAVVESVGNLINQNLPSMIQGVNHQTTQQAELESAFYSRWPELNAEQHGGQIEAAAKALVSANPGITRELLTEQTGVMVMMQLGKTQIPAATQAPAATPAAAPHVPAAPTGISTPVTRPTNEFAAAAEEFLEAD